MQTPELGLLKISMVNRGYAGLGINTANVNAQQRAMDTAEPAYKPPKVPSTQAPPTPAPTQAPAQGQAEPVKPAEATQTQGAANTQTDSTPTNVQIPKLDAGTIGKSIGAGVLSAIPMVGPALGLAAYQQMNKTGGVAVPKAVGTNSTLKPFKAWQNPYTSTVKPSAGKLLDTNNYSEVTPAIDPVGSNAAKQRLDIQDVELNRFSADTKRQANLSDDDQAKMGRLSRSWSEARKDVNGGIRRKPLADAQALNLFNNYIGAGQRNIPKNILDNPAVQARLNSGTKAKGPSADLTEDVRPPASRHVHPSNVGPRAAPTGIQSGEQAQLPTSSNPRALGDAHHENMIRLATMPLDDPTTRQSRQTKELFDKIHATGRRVDDWSAGNRRDNANMTARLNNMTKGLNTYDSYLQAKGTDREAAAADKVRAARADIGSTNDPYPIATPSGEATPYREWHHPNLSNYSYDWNDSISKDPQVRLNQQMEAARRSGAFNNGVQYDAMGNYGAAEGDTVNPSVRRMRKRGSYPNNSSWLDYVRSQQ